MPRRFVPGEEASYVLRHALDEHAGCNSTCSVLAAWDEGLMYCAAQQIVDGGWENGDLSAALDWLDPDSSIRETEFGRFATVSAAECEVCGATNYG